MVSRNPSDGLEQLEQVRLQREREANQGYGGRNGDERHARRRLRLPRYRRLLADRSRHAGKHLPDGVVMVTIKP